MDNKTTRIKVIKMKYSDCGPSDPDSGEAGGTSTAQGLVSSSTRLPPFRPSEHPQISADFRIMRQIPESYLRRNRCLILGWPSPSRNTAMPICDRYTKKYHDLASIRMSHVIRFATLLQHRLRCPEVSAERCLFSDITDSDMDPHAPDLERSFDCIGIATTLYSKHLRRARVTEDQFRWLVEYFGGLPAWYYSWKPDHLI